MLVAAGPAVDLVFHALAFVRPRAGVAAVALAASSHDPAWIAFARASLPPDAVEPFERDATLLSALSAEAGVATSLPWLALLCPTPAALVRAATLELEALAPPLVASLEAQRALFGAPRAAVEILRCDAALAAPGFARAHADGIAPQVASEREALLADHAALVRAVPHLEGLAIELSPPLGPRGRGFGARVVVGTAWPRRGLDPRTPLALALHEAAVQLAARRLAERGDATWAAVERAALEAASALSLPPSVRAAYAGWVATLDTSALGRTAPRADVDCVVEALLRPSAAPA